MRIDELTTNLTTKDDFFEMANISPKKSGLPVVVWLSPKANNKHSARIKVSSSPKASMIGDIVIRIDPDIKLIHGQLDTETFDLVKQWVILNHSVIMDFWNEKIMYTEDLLSKVKSI